MFAVKAIYDGKNFTPEKPIEVEGAYEVVITFLEPAKEEDAPKKSPRSEIFGALKGQIWMSDDFDEPLEEFKEYM